MTSVSTHLALNPISPPQIWRQGGDAQFAAELQNLRVGECTPKLQAMMAGCERPLEAQSGVEPTMLCPHRATAETENNRQFALLTGPMEEYTCEDGATTTEAQTYLARLAEGAVDKLFQVSGF